MTTSSSRGPDSTIPLAPGYRIGCTIDTVAALWAQSLKEPDKALLSVNQVGEKSMWDVGIGDLVFALNQHMMQNANMPVSTRSHGKPLALANTSHLPHGIPNSKMQWMRNVLKYNEEEIDEVKREKLLSMIIFLGVAQNTFYMNAGNDDSPSQDGVPVMIGGTSTFITYYDKLPHVFQSVRAGLLSAGPNSGGMGMRVGSTNGAKLPLTVIPIEPRGTLHVMRTQMRLYANGLDPAKVGTGGGEPRSKLCSDLNIQNENFNEVMLQDDRNCANLTFGLLTTFKAMLVGFAMADGNTFGELGQALIELAGDDDPRVQQQRREAFEKKFDEALGLRTIPAVADNALGRRKQAQSTVSAVLLEVVGQKEGKSNDVSRLKTRSSYVHGFNSLVGAIKDIDFIYGRDIGRVVNIQPSKEAGRTAGKGWRDAEISMY